MDIGPLLDRCRQGDELAWEALVRGHQARIYGLAYHYVGSAEEARDLTQDVFIRIYKGLDACTEPGHFVPWTIRIARNACIDHLRRRKARPPSQDLPVDEAWDLAAGGPSPEDDYVADSRRRLVHLALQTLSELSREIILLKDIQGLQFEEIATLLDIPIGTLKSRSNRARLELARKVLALSGGRVPLENEAGAASAPGVARAPRAPREENLQ
jgi:RNA polymerase sigma-70 factor (ECF subfamily)